MSSPENCLLAVARAERPEEALAALTREGVTASWIAADGELRGGGPLAGSNPRAGEAPHQEEGEEESLLPLSLPHGERLILRPPAHAPRDVVDWAPVAELFSLTCERQRHLEALSAEMTELRKRAEESEALHVLGLTANRTLDAEDVVSLVARFTRSLLGGHYVTVSVRENGRVRTVKLSGTRDPGFPEVDPVGAAVVATGKPLVLPPLPAELDLQSHLAEGMIAALGVPLAHYGECIGALVVGYRHSYAPTGRDVRLALTLASHAAVALQNARLHGELASRTTELERAMGELRWSTEAKERFFATLSHELRTPLNATLGYLDLVLGEIHGPVPDALRPPLKGASRAARSLLHLVSDVLDLAKIDAGKFELSLSPSSLSALVREAVATVHPLAASQGLGVEVTVDDAFPLVQTDADRVRQILINLLSNAIKFTHAGEVRVSVRRRGEWAEISVSDTGPGIASEHHERIFREFEQVSDSGGGGTGLGLPISRKLARLLGGDVEVSSVSGAGSTFTLRLPLGAGTGVAR
jgi:signal transduction histidine kinase